MLQDFQQGGSAIHNWPVHKLYLSHRPQQQIRKAIILDSSRHGPSLPAEQLSDVSIEYLLTVKLNSHRLLLEPIPVINLLIRDEPVYHAHAVYGRPTNREHDDGRRPLSLDRKTSRLLQRHAV